MLFCYFQDLPPAFNLAMNESGGKKRGRPAGPATPRSPTPKRRSDRKPAPRNAQPVDARAPKSGPQMQASRAYHRRQRAKPKTRTRGTRNGIAKTVKYKRNTQDRRRARQSQRALRDRRQFAGAVRDALQAELREELSFDVVKKLSLNTFYSALADHGYRRGAAADLAHSLLGFHRDTVLRWARELEFTLFVCPGDLDPSLYGAILDKASFWASLRGKHGKTFSLLAEPDVQGQARSWLLAKVSARDEDVTVVDFQTWLNEYLANQLRAADLEDLSYSTARSFALNLGFEFGIRRKGIDYSLHERADVVLARADFIAAVHEERQQAQQPGAKPLADMVHDETVARTRGKRRFGWKLTDTTGTVLGSDNGVGVMFSDFLSPICGFFPETRETIEFGRQGYFTAQKFEAQVLFLLRTHVFCLLVLVLPQFYFVCWQTGLFAVREAIDRWREALSGSPPAPSTRQRDHPQAHG